jgi:hypothetical protein
LLHEQAGPGLLRLTRLGVFALWIVKLLLDPLWRLADLPRELYQPIGILALFPGVLLDRLLTTTGLTAFLLVTFLVLTLCLTNRSFAFTSTFAAILLTVYASLMRGFGPAVHTDIVLLLAVYVLAGFAWADFFQTKSGPVKTWAGAWSSYPVITIVLLLCLSYSLVGINRVCMGGWHVFTGDTMEVWAIDASLRGYYFNTNIGWHVPEWPLVALMLRLGLPFITLFEITAPLCLASSHYRWIFIPTMLSFHLLSLVFMNIFFFDDMLLYLLLIDWSRRFPILSNRPAAPTSPSPAYVPVEASSAAPAP